MTKFELPEKPKKTNTSEDFNNLRKAVDELDKFDYAWKTHANKADRRINAANKYIEELERENQRLIAENLGVKTLVDNARPQQALPVVPECVDLLIKVCKEMNFDVRNAFSVGPYEIDNIEDECFVWMRNNSNEFALAFITGKYTVEKSDKCMVKLGALYFKCWNEVDAVFIIDDQPGAYESAFVFNKREDAEKVAQLVGGRVVKN